MTAQSIVCGSCSAEVPYGRLSCQSCGELLASVAGSRRVPASAAPSKVPDVLYDAASAPTAAVVDGPLSVESARRDVEAELPWAISTTHGAGLVDGANGADVDADDLLDSDDTSSITAGPAWAVGGTGLAGSPTPSYMPRPATGVGVAPGPSFAGPGAYVPPLPMTVVPAGPPAPARAWAGHGPEPSFPPDVAPNSPSGVDASGAPAADRQARFAEFVGWLSVAGAAFAAVGFLLPWGLVVIGSAGVDYFDRWGLSGPGHVIIAVAMLGVLALALIKNDIPVWIRTGLIGLGLGAYLLGLVWPYIFALPGTGPGALIAAIGAVALSVAGLLALITERHAGIDRSV
jgi:hypothetical protein